MAGVFQPSPNCSALPRHPLAEIWAAPIRRRECQRISGLDVRATSSVNVFSGWSHLMRAGEREWPLGLPRPLADAGTLLRYAMGESTCSVAGLRPELVGRAVPSVATDEGGTLPGCVSPSPTISQKINTGNRE